MLLYVSDDVQIKTWQTVAVRCWSKVAFTLHKGITSWTIQGWPEMQTQNRKVSNIFAPHKANNAATQSKRWYHERGRKKCIPLQANSLRDTDKGLEVGRVATKSIVTRGTRQATAQDKIQCYQPECCERNTWRNVFDFLPLNKIPNLLVVLRCCCAEPLSVDRIFCDSFISP